MSNINNFLSYCISCRIWNSTTQNVIVNYLQTGCSVNQRYSSNQLNQPNPPIFAYIARLAPVEFFASLFDGTYNNDPPNVNILYIFDDGQHNILTDCIRRNREDICLFLINQTNININHNHNNISTLTLAAINNREQVVRALLNKNVNVSSFLKYCCLRYNLPPFLEIVFDHIILNTGEDIDFLVLTELLYLYCYHYEQDNDRIITLLQRDDRLIMNEDFIISMMDCQNYEILKYIITRVDLNIINRRYIDSSYCTLLEFYSDETRPEEIKFLFERGVNINDQGFINNICGHGLTDILLDVIDHVDPLILNPPSGQIHKSPLMRACCGGHLDIIEILLERGCNINYKQEDRPILHDVLDSSLNSGIKLDVIRKLIEYGVDLNNTDYVGRNVLFYATNVNILNTLILYGCNINQTDLSGWSPLKFAIIQYRHKIVSALLKFTPSPIGLSNVNKLKAYSIPPDQQNKYELIWQKMVAELRAYGI